MKNKIWCELFLIVVILVVQKANGDHDEKVKVPISVHETGPNCRTKCGAGALCENYKPGDQCLCFWGWTGKNAVYVEKNLVRADSCTKPCHFTHDYQNPMCADKEYVDKYRYIDECHNEKEGWEVMKKPKNKKKCSYGYLYYAKKHFEKYLEYPYDDFNCHYLCGYGKYRHAGRCIGKGKCLCWWGYTGPDAKYVKKGPWKGRIVASFCSIPCEYGPSYKNEECLADYYTEKNYRYVEDGDVGPVTVAVRSAA